MVDVIEQTDRVIDALNNADFVKNMVTLRNEIIDSNVVIDIEDDKVKEYISNQNIFDFHIYYLNNEINKLINNKMCGSNNESN